MYLLYFYPPPTECLRQDDAVLVAQCWRLTAGGRARGRVVGGRVSGLLQRLVGLGALLLGDVGAAVLHHDLRQTEAHLETGAVLTETNSFISGVGRDRRGLVVSRLGVRPVLAEQSSLVNPGVEAQPSHSDGRDHAQVLV